MKLYQVTHFHFFQIHKASLSVDLILMHEHLMIRLFSIQSPLNEKLNKIYKNIYTLAKIYFFYFHINNCF